MTVINPEDQIVASAYDETTRTCFYTYQHSDGSRYTVKVTLDELNAHAGNKQARRNHIAQKILSHIQSNPPDGHSA